MWIYSDLMYFNGILMGFDRESPFMSYFVFGFGVEILEPGWGCL